MSVLTTAALLAIAIATLFASRRVLAWAGETRWFVAANLAAMVLGFEALFTTRLFDDLLIGTLVGATPIIAFVLYTKAWRVRLRLPAMTPPIWWLVIALGLVGVFWTALIGHFFDELWLHYNLISVMARGVSPPEHPLYPGAIFPYHYGFDLLAAQVMAFTEASPESSVDVVKLVSYPLLLWTAAGVGRALTNPRGGAIAAAVVPLGSSLLSYFLFRGMGELQLHWSAVPASWLPTFVPPVIINFFQHPQGLSMSLALAAVALFQTTMTARSPRMRLLLAVYLGMLSLFHIVFFLVLGAGFGAAVLLHRRRQRRALIADLLALAGALPLAWLAGGFFAASTSGPNVLKWGASFFNEPLSQSILHHLFTFGLPLLAVPFALFLSARRARPDRTALLVCVAVGMTIPNLVTYEKSWDVVKFYTVGALFLNVLWAEALSQPRLTKGLGRAALVALFVLSTSTSWLWLTRTTVLNGRRGISRWVEHPPSPIAKAVLRQVGDQIGPREYVLSTNTDLSKVGFMTPGFDPKTVGGEAYPIDHAGARQLARHRARARRTLDPQDLDALEVRWLILGPGDHQALTSSARAMLEDSSQFELVDTVEVPGDWRKVYRRRPR